MPNFSLLPSSFLSIIAREEEEETAEIQKGIPSRKEKESVCLHINTQSLRFTSFP